MNVKTIEDETPLWIQEFDSGLPEDWREDDLFLYAECKVCTRAVWASNDPGVLEWKHYAPPQFHKPEFPIPCFTPDPKPDTVIGEQRKQPEEPKGIFQQKVDKQPESAEMLLFMFSAQDRFLFGKLVERNLKNFTEGEKSLCRRMLLSLKSDYVMNEGTEVPNPEGVPEEDK